MRCLIVEDNEFIRVQARLFLMDHADIELALSAREAVQLFSRALAEGAPFDLVLLDAQAPEIEGLDVLQQLRRAEEESLVPRRNRSVIVLTTASEYTEELEQVVRGQLTHLIVKQVIRDDLMALLQRYQLV